MPCAATEEISYTLFHSKPLKYCKARQNAKCLKSVKQKAKGLMQKT